MLIKIYKKLTRKLILYGYNTRTKIMRLEYSNGDIEEYKGDCTVWHKLPNFERANNELFLCNLQEKIKHYSNF